MSIETPWECLKCGRPHPTPPPKGTIDCECGAVLELGVEPLPLKPFGLLFLDSTKDIQVINLKGLKRLDICDE